MRCTLRFGLVGFLGLFGFYGCGFTKSDQGHPDGMTPADADPNAPDSPGPDAEVLRAIPHVPAASATRVGEDVALTGTVTINTTSLTIMPAAAAAAATIDTIVQAGGPEIMLIRAHAFSVATGAKVTVRGSRALVILADTITIDGAIDGGAQGANAGPGAISIEGNGHDGSHHATYHDGGGGGGGFGQNGAFGGAAGTAAACAAGLALAGGGGSKFGDAALAVLQGGSRGGVGSPGACTVNQPGAGGGAIQLSAWTRISIAGSINAGGGGGQGGLYCNGLDSGAGNGGGAGGGLFIDAPMVQLAGLLGANGGAGGGGASGGLGQDGKPGADGKVAMAQASGGAATGSDGSPGGKGASAAGVATVGADSPCNGNGGGGGGETGRIVVRTHAAFAPTGTSTPAANVVTF